MLFRSSQSTDIDTKCQQCSIAVLLPLDADVARAVALVGVDVDGCDPPDLSLGSGSSWSWQKITITAPSNDQYQEQSPLVLTIWLKLDIKITWKAKRIVLVLVDGYRGEDLGLEPGGNLKCQATAKRRPSAEKLGTRASSLTSTLTVFYLLYEPQRSSEKR